MTVQTIAVLLGAESCMVEQCQNAAVWCVLIDDAYAYVCEEDRALLTNHAIVILPAQ